MLTRAMLMPSSHSEGQLFGLRYMGAIFGMLVCFGAVGVVALSMGVQPAVYNAHVPPGESTCTGIQCFRLFHLVCAVENVAGTCGIVFLLRTLNKHRTDQAARTLTDVNDDDT